MKRLSKDLADKITMDMLISISKIEDVSIDFSKDSLNIINNEIDSSIFTGVLLTKSRPSLFDDKEINMKATIISSLHTIFTNALINRSNFSEDLAKEFDINDKSKCITSTKLDFAVSQFVNAFYEYERIEKKYPELMKFM